jgi:two-component system response regulator TctD
VLPDVVLLDLSLPGLDGLQVLAAARAEGLVTPVLILTARGTVGDRVLGLNTGADDYLAKPFDLDELEARVRALARRAAPAAATRAARPPSAGLRLDDRSGAVYLQGQPLELAPREAALLRALLARPGQAVAKERLFELVFPGEPRCSPTPSRWWPTGCARSCSRHRCELVTLRGLGYLLLRGGVTPLHAPGRRRRCAGGCCWASWCRCWPSC